MIDAEAVLKNVLETLGVPVERLRYRGMASTFVTYQLVIGIDTAFSDDEGGAEEWTYRVDIYAKKDFIPLLRRAKATLKSAGFYGLTIDPEVYEQDTGFYHVPIEARYMMEV